MSVPVASSRYRRRVVDDELDALFGSLAAISIEGAKAVGKTATSSQRARTVYELDEPNQKGLAEADLDRLLEGERPVLIRVAARAGVVGPGSGRRRRSGHATGALSSDRVGGAPS